MLMFFFVRFSFAFFLFFCLPKRKSLNSSIFTSSFMTGFIHSILYQSVLNEESNLSSSSFSFSPPFLLFLSENFCSSPRKRRKRIKCSFKDYWPLFLNMEEIRTCKRRERERERREKDKGGRKKRKKEMKEEIFHPFTQRLISLPPSFSHSISEFLLIPSLSPLVLSPLIRSFSVPHVFCLSFDIFSSSTS